MTRLRGTNACVININGSIIIQANVFKFSKMCRECVPFTGTFRKLAAIQKQNVFFVTDFRQVWIVSIQSRGNTVSGLGFSYRE